MKKENPRKHDYLTYMAILVSISALVVSVTQTYYQHKTLYASAWPHLQVSVDREEYADTNKNIISVKILNKGVGPAIIESVVYQYKNKKYEGEKYESIENLVKAVIGSSFSGSYKPIYPEEVISHDESIMHLSVIGAKNTRLFNEAIPEIKMRIVYQSIYKERWEIVVDANMPNFTRTTKLD